MVHSRLRSAMGLAVLLGAPLLGALPAAPSQAFDPDDLAHFMQTGDCPGCDLSEADLKHFGVGDSAIKAGDLRGVDLHGAYLLGAELSGADLRGADLRGATLGAARLSGALLQGADLSGAGGAFLRLDGADLSGAKLRDMEACYDQIFAGAVLRGADLTGATLCTTNWAGADLAGAILRGADLTLSNGLEQRQLDQACGDETTKYSPGELTLATCAEPAGQ